MSYKFYFCISKPADSTVKIYVIFFVLTDLRRSNDKGIDELEHRIKTIEDGNQEDIKESVKYMKDDVLQSLREDIDNLVNTRVNY